MQDWHHVPETPNPANKVSRGLGPSSLTADHRMLRLPNFLWQPETCWPNEVHGNVLDDSLELKKKIHILSAKLGLEIGWEKKGRLGA